MDVREKATNEKRLIDANKIINDIGLYMAENSYLNDTPLDILKMVADWIKYSQTVDAVEVVRCKNCEYWKPYSGRIDAKVCYATFDCHGRERLTNPDDFCSCGKRKEGADNG